jgi:hypothetical protein
MLNPSNQITASVAYNANGAAGITLQSSAIVIEDDLNALRSQVSRLFDATMGGNWYDDVSVVNGKKRSVKQLNTGLDTLETKTLLARVSSAASVAVPSGQNYVILSAASAQAPSGNIAIALGSLGAVAAQSTFNAAAFGANELTAIAGNIPQQPRNLVVIRDAVTEQVIESGGFDVFALLQVESTATDGASFNDASGGNRGKLSFVVMNPTTGSLTAAAAADIAGHTIQYSYVMRSTLALMPEQNFLGSGVFTDSIADTNITLTRAVANQAGSPVPVATDVLWRVANGNNFKVQNQSGSSDLFGISPTGSGNAAYINTDSFAISTTTAVTSVKGVSVATGGQPINVGVATGVINTTGSLTVQTLGSSPLALNSSAALTLTDGFESAGGWSATSIPLASSAADWSLYKSLYGETSLLAGIAQAGQRSSHKLAYGVITAVVVPAGTNITGAGSAANLDAQLLNYAANANYTSSVKVFVNGVLMRPGASPTDTSKDWYPGTSPATGDIKLTFPMRIGDTLVTEVFSNPLDASGE